MAEFALRAATEDDAAAIRTLIHKVQINPMALDWHRFVLAVNAAGEMIGCGQLKPHGGNIVELASIAVEPAYQAQGVARAIIEYLLARSPRPLYLTCRARLGAFYQQWGFRALGLSEMPVYFRRLARVAALLMAITKDDDGMLVMMLQ